MPNWSANDLPSFKGRTVIVTGANSGLGLETARELARAGAHVIMAVRNTDKGNAARTTITGDTEVRPLDLADLSSVKAFADTVDSVDVLVNNAGIMMLPYAKTVDGFESQIGTNHFGHFALTNLLLPKINDRVVTVSSYMHYLGDLDLSDLNYEKRRYRRGQAYCDAKLANLLFASELHRRLTAAGSHVRSVAAHPGYAATELQSDTGSTAIDLALKATLPFAQSARSGALPSLYAASQDLPGNSFVGPRYLNFRGAPKVAGRSAKAKDADQATRLWDLSEQLTAVAFAL